MKRPPAISCPPRSRSWRSAQARRACELPAAEESPHRALAEAAADEVRDVVAEERADRGAHDDQRQVEVAGRGDDAGGDHRRLARHDRDERVEQGEHEHDHVRPARRIRHQVGELVEHGRSARSRPSPRGSWLHEHHRPGSERRQLERRRCRPRAGPRAARARARLREAADDDRAPRRARGAGAARPPSSAGIGRFGVSQPASSWPDRLIRWSTRACARVDDAQPERAGQRIGRDRRARQHDGDLLVDRRPRACASAPPTGRRARRRAARAGRGAARSSSSVAASARWWRG